MKKYEESIKPNIINSVVDSNCFIDVLTRIENSTLYKKTKVYKLSRVRDTVINESSSVGDSSKVDMSNLSSYVRIDRFNHIYQSSIGNHSYTGQGTVIMHTKVGKFTSISWGVTIGPANHDYERVTNHSFLYNTYDGLRDNDEIPYNRFQAECTIGNDVWIGTNATILRDVAIGDGAVVGANSVVTKDVPPYAIVAGVPARVIKYRFTKEIINKLMELKWWNLSDEIIRSNFDVFKSKPDIETLNQLTQICSNRN